MSNQDMTGQVAIVTGGASGIGRAATERFAAAGASVVIADLNAAGAQELAAKVVADGGAAIGVRVDVTNAADTDTMVTAAEDAFGRVDVLVANAGLSHLPMSALDMEENDFDRTFAVNVKGAWLSVRSAVPAMRRTGGGSIVITGSVMGERTRPGFAAYASSKAASNHLARTLALELAPDIRVNAVAPVATETAMLSNFLGRDDPEASRAAFVAGIPLGRLASPYDIADGIVFLSSDAARFISGVVLPVDGGRSI
jgi:3-oxoacyl-[acyl-carrier protein] reductase